MCIYMCIHLSLVGNGLVKIAISFLVQLYELYAYIHSSENSESQDQRNARRDCVLFAKDRTAPVVNIIISDSTE
jgi:hypothetical protein